MNTTKIRLPKLYQTILCVLLVFIGGTRAMAQNATVAIPVGIGSPCGVGGSASDSIKYFDYNSMTNVLTFRYRCQPQLAFPGFSDNLATISFNPFDGYLYFSQIARIGGTYNTYIYRWLPNGACPTGPLPVYRTFINKFVAGLEFDPANGLGYQVNFVDTSAGSAPFTVDANLTMGQFTSHATVNGLPAVSYYNQTTGDLKYIIADYADGSEWNTAASITVDAGGFGFVGQYSSLQVVNGNPAIAYYDLTNGDLKYVRATNVSGSAWGAPVTVTNAGDIGQFASMQIVNGNPAIAYYDVTNGDLKYVRATDANGTAWGAPVTLDAGGNVGQFVSMKIVNGNPAVGYYDVTNGDLKFVRATDVNGAAWAAGLTLDAPNNTGQYASMSIINGNPAIAYYDFTAGDLRYIRATNASGSAWGAGTNVVTAGTAGQYASLLVVNGNPAIAYYENATDLKYVRSTDVNGGTWGTPVTPDAVNNVGQYASMSISGGNPSITYYDATNADLMFVRSADVNGNKWFLASNVYNMELQQVNLAAGTTGVSLPINFGSRYIYRQSGDVVVTPGGQFLGVYDDKYFTLNWKDYGILPLTATFIDTFQLGAGVDLVGLSYSGGKLVGSITGGAGCPATTNYQEIDILTGARSAITYSAGPNPPIFKSADMTNISAGVGVAKSLISATESPIGSNTYNITYEVIIKNYGNTPVSALQVFDTLNNINGPLNVISSSISSFSAPPGFTQNPTYDGRTAGNFGLLVPGGTLSNIPGQNTITLRITCRISNILPGIVYNNRASATAVSIFGDNIKDFSTNGADPDLNSNDRPDDAGENQPTPLLISVTAQTPPCMALANVLYSQTFGAGVGMTTTIPAPVLATGVSLPLYSSLYTGSIVNPLPTDAYTVTNNPVLANSTNFVNITDHTGNPNGQMLVVNADAVNTVFYRGGFTTGMCANQQYSVSLYAAFIGNPAYKTICDAFGGFVYPKIKVRIRDGVSGLIITEVSTADITTSTWTQYGLKFIAPVSYANIIFELINDAPGGCGNDIAIDDIEFGSCSPLPNVGINNVNAGCLGGSASFKALLNDPGVIIGTPDYQWQESNDGISWSNIAAAPNSDTYTINPVLITHVNKYYRALVASAGNLGNPNCVYPSPSFYLVIGCDIDDDDDGITDVVESGGSDPNDDDDLDGIMNFRDPSFPGYVDANADNVNDNFDRDLDGVINSLDLDADNDGIPDVTEAGGVDNNGDGKIDNYSDSDLDGLSQNVDASITGMALSGNGLGLVDTDGDGIANQFDLDSDNDGIPDVREVQGTDANNDGKIDGYVDVDANGFSDNVTGLATGLLITSIDAGGDGRADNYPNKNLDADTRANPYDLDSDNDGISDVREAGFADANSNGFSDGVIGVDGWDDVIDALATLTLRNTDGVGNPNYLDIDSDDDGIPDNVEGIATTGYQFPLYLDGDNDGLDNRYDLTGGFGGNGITPNDQDADGFPDYIDSDTDNDGLIDRIEGNDFNLNNVPDDLVTLTGLDTDGDGLDDRFDNNNSSIKGTSRYMGPLGIITGDPLPGSTTMVQATMPGSERDWRITTFVLDANFISITANKIADLAKVNWVVSCDKIIDHFDISRSIDGINFSKAGQVKGISTICKSTPFSFSDDLSTVNSSVVYYRVTAVTTDNKYKHSQLVVIRSLFKSAITVSPNPASAYVNVTLNIVEAVPVEIHLLDGAGKLVKLKKFLARSGSNTFNINELEYLANGIYTITVKAGDAIQHKKLSIRH